jgi:hypothetical protein
MFTVFVKDFILGTVSEKNVSVEQIVKLFFDWNDGKDIMVKGISIKNKDIETISVKETGRNDY